MSISESKRLIFGKIMNGETPAQVCAGWDEQGKPPIEYVQRECALCESNLALDVKNQYKVKEINAVTICFDCYRAIVPLAGKVEYKSMIGGKIMTVREGIREIGLIKRRN